jgi:hypothetical protein
MKTHEFQHLMEDVIKQAGDKPFKPVAWYNEAGDIIEAVWEDCSVYAEWLNPQVTLLRKHKTDEIVGVQIWAVDVDGKDRRIKDVVQQKLPA